MQTEDIPISAGPGLDLATFGVHGQVYAIEVGQIREVVRCQELTPLPRAPRLIEGVLEARDAAIPVVDLGRALHASPVESLPGARIVILECEGLVFGLRVEAAIEVFSAGAGMLESPPALAIHAGYRAVSAMVRRPDASPALVLSLEHLLQCVSASGSEAGEEA